MNSRLFDDTLVVTLSRGDKLVECLKEACAANSVKTGSVSGIGSILSAELQNYIAETSSYADFSVDTPYEIISLLGNVSMKDGRIHTHLHVALSDSSGRLIGGHLKEAVINGNCEIFVRCLSSVLDRRLNPETGLSPLYLGEAKGSKTVVLPYGKGKMDLKIPEDAAVITSRIDELKSSEAGLEIVRKAMKDPVGSLPLCELARGKKTATLIISDHTRPVPSKDIVPLMLEEMRQGNPNIDITLLVATGCHRGTRVDELVDKLGADIVENEKIVIHDARDTESNVTVGTLPSGAPLVVNRLAVETELLVAEGFIEPHFFAGFSGGRKSVLPGVCDKATVFGNHCSRFIDSPYARTGILDGNPIHADMIAAGRMVNFAYIVNVVIDENKETVAAFAGDFEKAHRAGCDFLLNWCRVDKVPADIVVTTNGGAPLDQNIYQCTKGLSAAEATANPDAVIIICAECLDGHGGEGFYRYLKDCDSPAALYDSCMATAQEDTPQDQWQAQIQARIQAAHTVVFVTRPELKQTIEDMKMLYAASAQEAFEMAKKIKGNDASVTVIPNGISVIL